MNTVDLWSMESDLMASGFSSLCGIDEAGRGPLAGPVCAAAVMLPPGLVLPGLNDSKKLTEKKREALYDEIVSSALHYFLAMRRAYAQLGVTPDLALVDGNRDPGLDVPTRCVVKGDATCADIAAASILAKVTRDRYMLEMAERYPMYGFEKHKGYGTAAHYAALREYGPCQIHRPSFLKKMH